MDSMVVHVTLNGGWITACKQVSISHEPHGSYAARNPYEQTLDNSVSRYIYSSERYSRILSILRELHDNLCEDCEVKLT